MINAHHAFQFPVRLMQEPDAARYLGISASKLATLKIPRRVSGRNRLYDIHDLDAYASNLPYEGEEEGENECDIIFGLSG